MPTTRKTAEEILSAYKCFPSTYRPSQEDIIKTLRGETIRGKSIYANDNEISNEQIYEIALRLYGEAKQVRERAQIRKAGLEAKVEKEQSQTFLFDTVNPQ